MDIDRLIELVSDRTAVAIWKDLSSYRKVKSEDSDDTRAVRLEVESAIDAVYGMAPEDLDELVAALDEIDKGQGDRDEE